MVSNDRGVGSAGAEGARGVSPPHKFWLQGHQGRSPVTNLTSTFKSLYTDSNYSLYLYSSFYPSLLYSLSGVIVHRQPNFANRHYTIIVVPQS